VVWPRGLVYIILIAIWPEKLPQIIQDLKDMHNSKSAIYSLAVGLGIPDGMVRRFKTELARFKEALKLEREIRCWHRKFSSPVTYTSFKLICS
jgi:hypothetical protein